MAADTTIAKTFAELYTLDQIETALRAALDDYKANVVMTSANLGGHGTSGQINGRTEDVVATLRLAYQLKKGTTERAEPPPMASRANLSTMLTEQ